VNSNKPKRTLKGKFLLNLTQDCLFTSIFPSPKDLCQKLLRIFAEHKQTLTLDEAALIAFGDNPDPISILTQINIKNFFNLGRTLQAIGLIQKTNGRYKYKGSKGLEEFVRTSKQIYNINFEKRCISVQKYFKPRILQPYKENFVISRKRELVKLPTQTVFTKESAFKRFGSEIINNTTLANL